MFRVIVTGSRTWRDRQRVWDELDALPRPLVVVHGDAYDGADSFAHQWCALRYADEGVAEEKHPALWDVHTPDCRHRNQELPWCPVAGFRRNGEMITSGGDLVLAFGQLCAKVLCRGRRPHLTHGTGDCIAAARAAGLTVREVREGNGNDQVHQVG